MTTPSISKHVFLEYQEYQRLLDTKARCEQLNEKVKELEKEVERLKSAKNLEGSGNLSGILAREDQEDQVKTPLLEIMDSITMPPSANLTNGELLPHSTSSSKPWYFLGIPRGSASSS